MAISRHPLCPEQALTALGGVPLDQALIVRLEHSFARLAEEGPLLGRRFYECLFAAQPESRAAFPASLETAERELVAALQLIVANLRTPQVIRPRLQELGRRHAAGGIRRGHYGLALHCLLAAMAELRGTAWTTELERDWHSVLRLVADIMSAAHSDDAGPPTAPSCATPH